MLQEVKVWIERCSSFPLMKSGAHCKFQCQHAPFPRHLMSQLKNFYKYCGLFPCRQQWTCKLPLWVNQQHLLKYIPWISDHSNIHKIQLISKQLFCRTQNNNMATVQNLRLGFDSWQFISVTDTTPSNSVQISEALLRILTIRNPMKEDSCSNACQF